MKIEGTVVEMGDLEGIVTPGIRIETGEGLVEIIGLPREQLKAMPPVMFRKVTLTIEPAA